MYNDITLPYLTLYFYVVYLLYKYILKVFVIFRVKPLIKCLFLQKLLTTCLYCFSKILYRSTHSLWVTSNNFKHCSIKFQWFYSISIVYILLQKIDNEMNKGCQLFFHLFLKMCKHHATYPPPPFFFKEKSLNV